MGADVGPTFKTGDHEKGNIGLEHVVKVVIVAFPATAGNEALLLSVEDVRVDRAIEEVAHHEVDTEDGEN